MGLLNKKKEDAGEVVVAAAVVDNKVEHIDTTKSFEEHVARFKKIIENNRKKSIQTIWEIGAFVNILKGEKAYGKKTVESFVEAMDDITVSKSEVYKYAQFAERYTKDDVNRILDKKNMGWQVVSNLIRVKDDEARKLLEDKVDSGELPPSKIQNVVSKLNNKIKSAASSSKSSTGDNVNRCTASFRKVNNLLEKILTMQESCAKDISDLSLILDDEPKYEKACDVMDEFRELAPKAQKTMEALLEELNKTI